MIRQNIEVEVRSFITKSQYDSLIDFFRLNGTFMGYDEQVTHYFDAPSDVRIQKGSAHAKIWLKKGRMHDEQREEIEFMLPRNDFEKLEQMFAMLGFPIKVKWFRKRHSFIWKGFTVSVDDNKGYGYILEIEKKTDDERKSEVLVDLKNAFSTLGIDITPKDIFDDKYNFYLKNWKTLVK